MKLNRNTTLGEIYDACHAVDRCEPKCRFYNKSAKVPCSISELDCPYDWKLSEDENTNLMDCIEKYAKRSCDEMCKLAEKYNCDRMIPLEFYAGMVKGMADKMTTEERNSEHEGMGNQRN